MSRPTQIASGHFQRAMQQSYEAAEFKDIARLAGAVNALASGLDNMNTGLRATYMLLEEVKELLKPQQFGRQVRPDSSTAAPGGVSIRDR